MVVLSRTVSRRDATAEPTGMYSRRVLERITVTGEYAHPQSQYTSASSNLLNQPAHAHVIYRC